MGQVNDSYICSNQAMLRAYKSRPNTFKFRVLEYVYEFDKKLLHQVEQKWLDKIKPHELMNTQNVYNKTCRYYNVKRLAAGGSEKGHTKNRTAPAWNKGLTKEDIKNRKKKQYQIRVKKAKITRRSGYCIICTNLTYDNRLTCSQECQTASRMFGKSCAINYKNCISCGRLFVIKEKSQKQVCSLSCAARQVKNRKGFSKGHSPWNKGQPNPIAAENGKRGAAAQSKTRLGGKRMYRDDGSWYWWFPNKK